MKSSALLRGICLFRIALLPLEHVHERALTGRRGLQDPAQSLPIFSATQGRYRDSENGAWKLVRRRSMVLECESQANGTSGEQRKYLAS